MVSKNIFLLKKSLKRNNLENSKINCQKPTEKVGPHSEISTNLVVPKNTGLLLIGEGLKVKGEIQNCSEVEIYGNLEGNIEAGSIVVHNRGHVKGNFKAETAEIFGKVEGEILVTNQLDIRSSGLVDGNTFYGGFSVETGGRVLGTVGHHVKNFDKDLVKSKHVTNKSKEEGITTLINSQSKI